jgi:hypothetical protein
MNLLIKIKNKKQNKFIVSKRLYIGITDTINGFRSTLACCEVVTALVCCQRGSSPAVAVAVAVVARACRQRGASPAVQSSCVPVARAWP